MQEQTRELPGTGERRTEHLVESHGLRYIPSNARHGKTTSLLYLWFASNCNIVVIAYGVTVVALGLSLPYAMAAIGTGIVLGTPIMAYHSAQGPKMGLPQMVTSRAQFGLYGAVLPTIVAFLTFAVFAILDPVLIGPATGSLLHVSAAWGAIIFDAVALIVTWVGYDLIHRVARVISVVTVIFFLALIVKYSFVVSGPHVSTAGKPTAATFILAVSLIVLEQVGWAPYVADYSRYLPEETSIRSAFLTTAVGSALGALLSAVLGVLVAFVALPQATGEPAAFLAGSFGSARPFFLLLLIIGLLPSQIETIYGGFMTAYNAASPTGRGSPATIRVIATTLFAAIVTVIAIVAHGHLITLVINASDILLYLLIPWTAVNLIDFYWVRRGVYNKDSFFTSTVYGSVQWMSVGIYVLVVALEVPFMSTTFFVGPVASAMGGSDISWIVGFSVAAVLYGLSKRTVRVSPGAAKALAVSPLGNDG